MEIVVSHEADQDLKEIRSYSGKRWGNEQARAYIEKIESAFSFIATQPKAGRAYGTYLKYNVERHSIFYRFNNHRIFIVRVLHQQMQYERHLN